MKALKNIWLNSTVSTLVTLPLIAVSCSNLNKKPVKGKETTNNNKKSDKSNNTDNKAFKPNDKKEKQLKDDLNKKDVIEPNNNKQSNQDNHSTNNENSDLKNQKPINKDNKQTNNTLNNKNNQDNKIDTSINNENNKVIEEPNTDQNNNNKNKDTKNDTNTSNEGMDKTPTKNVNNKNQESNSNSNDKTNNDLTNHQNTDNTSVNNRDTSSSKPLINQPDTINNDQILSNDQVLNYYNSHPELRKYNETPFDTKLFYDTNQDYVNHILSRSFALRWDFNDGGYSGGTAWLLDYHKVDNDGNYKLFLATNYHVAVDIYGPNDYQEWAQPNRSNNPIKDFYIGFDVKNSASVGVKKWAKNTKFNKNFAYRILKPNSIPKVIFLAQNFTQNTQNIANKNYYSDFAVLEWDINLNQALNQNDILYPNDYNQAAIKYLLKQQNIEWKLMTEHIKDAISALDSSYSKYTNKSNFIRNTDYSLPYATVNYDTMVYARRHFFDDYTPLEFDQIGPNTINKINDLSNYINTYLSDKTYWYPSNLYYAGFPFFVDKSQTFTNVVKGYENQLGYKGFDLDRPYIYLDYDFNNKQVGDKNNTVFNNLTKSYFYGVSYRIFSVNQIVGGMSGSLTLDQQGLPIGLLWGNEGTGTVLINDSYQNSYNPVFVPFVQNRTFTTNDLTVYPYNLIDGTDKNKYPMQINSYREMLRKIYGQNSFSTKLFPNGI
ncbi:hypothetical protein GE118_00075 [Mycoplasma sp. NEAQ87857]|uniref:MIP family Ig-specific serine endopeptidase n=1 Tax=Mycoplasma sp. NEAQ87857 TaxID=2683967 RepID=UPI001318CF36|nr:hypothetical protein [Mycoplasma sp. NEAQ87857]QGZ97199.1 hypothetical protein GE118_00075 [Mycoplasma sp. NEAQ87857]